MKLSAVAALLVSACGGTTYQPLNPEGVSVETTDNNIRIVLEGETFTLSRSEPLNTSPLLGGTDYTPFIYGSNTGPDEQRKVAVLHETDATAVGMHVDFDGFTMVDTFALRKAAFEPPAGTASLTGTFVSTTQFGASGPNFWPGEITLEVSFDDATISGEITNNVVTIIGLPITPQVERLILTPTTIDRDGQFVGELDRDDLASNFDSDVVIDVAEFSGLLGGTSETEAVGAVRFGTETNAGLVGAVGIFTASE